MEMGNPCGSIPIPLGYYFEPKEEDLLLYLHNKVVQGSGFTSSDVHDCELFGDTEPWLLWEKHGGADDDALYFFAKRKPMSAKSSRFDRKIGRTAGTWSGGNFRKVVGKRISGGKRDFRYEETGIGSGSVHHNAWLMREFEISCSNVWVLCVLKKSPRKPPPPTPTPTKKRKEGIGDDDKKSKQPSKKSKDTTTMPMPMPVDDPLVLPADSSQQYHQHLEPDDFFEDLFNGFDATATISEPQSYVSHEGDMNIQSSNEFEQCQNGSNVPPAISEESSVLAPQYQSFGDDYSFATDYNHLLPYPDTYLEYFDITDYNFQSENH